MLRTLCYGLLFLSFPLSTLAIHVGYPRCNCYLDSYISTEGILECQRISDFLIASAYFSIPLELLYFATCSDLFPFKWIVFQFGAFIVLCGLTHFLTVFTYEPHSFLLMLSLTISKLLTALVSIATVITMLTLIPQLLRLKVRENFLRIKTEEMDREVGLMKRQEEASWNVRMLTQEIRKSLDRHTVLDTTLVELSTSLGLQNCAIWMPDDDNKVMNLSHELRQRHSMESFENSIPIIDQDVFDVNESKGARILRPDSLLALASSRGDLEPGPIAAIRMPILKVSNFKGGTPESVIASYAILVLVFPGDYSRIWSFHEQEMIEVIADQVAVALSHASLLEDSQLLRDKLVEQNTALLQEKQTALMASEARKSFQKVMSQGVRRPVHYILNLLSIMQQEESSPKQRLIINSITKAGLVVSNLVTDAMEMSSFNNEGLTLDMTLFYLHSLIKEAAIAAMCICNRRGFAFSFQVDNAVPDAVVGDEKKIFNVILHVIDKLLSGYSEGCVCLQVHLISEPQHSDDQQWITWKPNYPGVSMKFEIGMGKPESTDSSLMDERIWRLNAEGSEIGLNFNMCKKIVQMMHGDILVVLNPQGFPRSIELVLHFKLQSHTPLSELKAPLAISHSHPTPNFKGLRVLLADNDGLSRTVTGKLLKKLGCEVSSVSSATQCLNSFSASAKSYKLVIVDLHMLKIGGFEIAAWIRKLRSRQRPAIVGLTAIAEDHVWQHCLHSGMNGLIRKPVMLKALGDELYRVLYNT